MKLAFFFATLLALPVIGTAKTETARIEITRDKRVIVTLVGEQSAGQFTIWSGPGTTFGPAEGPRQMSTSALDYADWLAGRVEPPARPQVYEVRFYCAGRAATERETAPIKLCYGVRYAIDSHTGQGYFQIPPEDDPEFPFGAQAIARGVEGSWYRASSRWEKLVRPQIEAALSRH